MIYPTITLHLVRGFRVVVHILPPHRVVIVLTINSVETHLNKIHI